MHTYITYIDSYIYIAVSHTDKCTYTAYIHTYISRCCVELTETYIKHINTNRHLHTYIHTHTHTYIQIQCVHKISKHENIHEHAHTHIHSFIHA